MDDDADIKCEIRRIVSWCNNKFYSEVIKIIINEKVIRLLLNQGTPRTNLLTIAKKNQTFHLDYLSNLLEMRSFLAGDKISCADIAGACHISILDYFGEINWDKWPNLRYWYAIIKSRPSFRQLLQDRIAGFIPYNTYMDLDF
jgi:glutathione S-transferase